MPSMENVRRSILAGQCPFCESKKHFIVPAHHISVTHGINQHELRKMAGLNRGTSICDSDYADKCAQMARDKSLETKTKFQNARRALGILPNPPLRPEGKINRSNYLFNPVRIARSVIVLHTPEAKAKAKLAAKCRSPKIVEEQTLRIKQARNRWLATSTPEEKKEKGRQAYLTRIKNNGQEYVNQQFANMRKNIPHEAQVRAAQRAAEVLRKPHPCSVCDNTVLTSHRATCSPSCATIAKQRAGVSSMKKINERRLNKTAN